MNTRMEGAEVFREQGRHRHNTVW